MVVESTRRRGRVRSIAWRGARMLAATLLAASTVAVAGSLAGPAPSAQAAESLPTTGIRLFQTFFAWADAGENLDIVFTPETANNRVGAVVVTDPAGVESTCPMPLGMTAPCTFTDLTSTTAGVWTVRYDRDPTDASTTLWSIQVQDGTTTIPGRVWSDEFKLKNDLPIDLDLWYVGSTGHKYAATYDGYIGIDSVFRANQFGVVHADEDAEGCVSAYSSRGAENPDYIRSGTECGVPYHVFFEEPAADLPASAPIGTGGTVFVAPPVQNPTVSDLAFAPNDAGTRAGTFTFDAAGHVGNADLLIDADGDGSYTGPADRVIPITITADTAQSVSFDGLDGQGNPIAPETLFNATVRITQAGEIHFVNNDVEARSGLTVTALNGNAAGTSTLYWNDTELNVAQHTASCLPPVLDGRAGFDSSVAGGVHGWPCYPVENPNDGVSGPWGDVRDIDDWTFNPVNVTAAIEVPNETNYTVVKSSDPAPGSSVRIGDVVTYTIDVTQIGNAPAPAELTDDLSAVLDDASYNGDVSATEGDVELTGSTLAWSGTLPVGGSARITYSVTVTGDGDGTLANTVTSPGCASSEDCATTHLIGSYTVVKDSDPASGSSVSVGDTIAYTVTITQDGPGAVTGASLVDDLSGVLDDAGYNGDLVASAGTAEFDPQTQTVSWSGDLAVGAVVTLAYSVTVTGDGDADLVNVVTSDGCADAPSCTTEHPVGSYVFSKSSNPASGATVHAGDRITYTITVTQTGTGPIADARITDDLSGVLDDATFEGTPTASSGQVARSGSTLSWHGDLAPGQVVTITYSVTVTGSGDRVIANVVGSDDARGGCDPNAVCATRHDVPPAAGLAITGGTLADGALLGGVLLALTGGALLLLRRTRKDIAA